MKFQLCIPAPSGAGIFLFSLNREGSTAGYFMV